MAASNLQIAVAHVLCYIAYVPMADVMCTQDLFENKTNLYVWYTCKNFPLTMSSTTGTVLKQIGSEQIPKSTIAALGTGTVGNIEA